MNNVNLLARLVYDIELRQTASGVSIAKFRVAVNRPFKNANGEREADFINCVAYRQTAELIARYFAKGSMIALDGRIQTGSYENQQGQKVYTTDIVVNNFYFVGSQNNAQNANNGGFGQGNMNNQMNQNNATAGQYGANLGYSQGFEITDSDLPF